MVLSFENNGKGRILIKVYQVHYRNLRLCCWMADKVISWGTKEEILFSSPSEVLQKPWFLKEL